MMTAPQISKAVCNRPKEGIGRFESCEFERCFHEHDDYDLYMSGMHTYIDDTRIAPSVNHGAGSREQQMETTRCIYECSLVREARKAETPLPLRSWFTPTMKRF